MARAYRLEDLGKIFEPFYTKKVMGQERDGTGAGRCLGDGEGP